MILQCDQCNTKFKLDDAKIKDGGVKVRCSKCKHVFLVSKDAQDETDFDSILDGLDAPAPATAAAAAGNTVAAAAEADITAPQVDFSHLKHALQASEASETVEADQPAADAFDFGSFNFDDDQDEVAKTEAGAADKSFDLSDFNADEEADLPADTQIVTGGAAVAEPPPQEKSSFEMSEFSFDEAGPEPEPAIKADESPADPLGYNDFSFSEEETPVSPTPEAEPASPGEFDFSEFSFDAGDAKDEQPSVGDKAGSATDTALDFGSFDFEQVEEPSKDMAEPASVPDFATAADEPFASPNLELDLTEGQIEQPSAEIPTPAAPEAESPGEFSFDFGAPEEPMPETAPPLGQPVTEHAGDADVPEFSFGDFSDEPPAELTMDKPAADAPAMETTKDLGAPDLEAIDFGQVASPVVPAEEHKSEPLFDDAIGGDLKDEVPPAAVTEADLQDEYPPLSITSRRKGSSFFSFAGIGVVVLILLALAGIGLFFIKTNPEGFKKLGLGAIAQGLGVKSAEDGRIMVKNPVGSFIVNKEAGELFVITGSAVNEYKKPRASIQVKASLFGKDGKPVMQKTVYCGNNLSREQLVSMPLDKLETAMNNQFGDSLSNLGVQPGKEIPFVVILSKVPQDVGEFGVEVVGSTVAGQ